MNNPKKPGRNHSIVWWISLCIVTLLGSLALVNGVSAVRLAQTLPVPTPYSQGEVARLEQFLAQPGIDQIMRRSLEEKLEMARSAARDQAAGILNNGIQSAALQPTPLTIMDHAINEGIFPGSEGMFGQGRAQINNYWQGQVLGEIVQVFAGASGQYPGQGILIVLVTSADRLNTREQVVAAAVGTGALTILSEQDGQIAVGASNGQSLTFDVTIMRFSELSGQ
jgi:hypothetical protein